MNIGIIGAGVVGYATGFGLSKIGHKVTFNDINEDILQKLNDKGYKVTRYYSELLRDSEIIQICVPTPNKDGIQDLSIISRVAEKLGKCLIKTEEYKVIVIRSTILPTYTRKKILPIIQETSGLIPGEEFGLCVNPEFLRQASALDDFLNSWRIVIGEYDEKSGSILEEVYKPLKTRIFRTTFEIAELIKYISNAFLSTKISFFNEMYLISDKLGVDPDLVNNIVALDPRIGKYGIKGGRPFGGVCLPKDLEAFIELFHLLDLNPSIISSVLKVNKEMQARNDI